MQQSTPNTKFLKKTPVVLVVLGLIFFAWQCHEMQETSLSFLDKEGNQQVLSLPLKDKKRLFCFMRMLMAEDNFAYTLLGSKPVSWACYKNPLPAEDWTMFYYALKKYHSALRKGWKTWSKYCHLFSAASFWTERSEKHPGWISILLVNEEHFNRVVNENKKDFQEVLNRKVVDGFQLLQEAKQRPLMSGVLKGHQALLGIVLGYGRNDSWRFLQGIETNNLLECIWDEENDRKPGMVKTRSIPTDTEECLFLESCPSFAGDPHSDESLLLKAEYLLTQEKVVNYFKDKDFLEASLSLFAGYRPV